MNLPAEAKSHFKEIFHREFGELLSDEEAQERAESFMRLVMIIVRPKRDFGEHLSRPPERLRAGKECTPSGLTV